MSSFLSKNHITFKREYTKIKHDVCYHPGYRLYDDGALDKLYMILVYRELGKMRPCAPDSEEAQNWVKELQAKYVSRRESKTGFVSQITRYECESREGCPYKSRCTKAEGNRKMTVSKRFIETEPKRSYSKKFPLNFHRGNKKQ